MRRLLPILLLAAVAVGCGDAGSTYSDAQVRQAFAGLIGGSQEFPTREFRPQFATLAAVTELRIEEGFVSPRAEYVGRGAFQVLRFATRQDAAIAEAAYQRLRLALAQPGNASVERAGNVLLVVTQPTPAAHEALGRLRGGT